MRIQAPYKTVIDLLRHGEPVGGRRYRGQTDDPLSEKGWLQMRSAVADRQDWDIIYCSPLRRCLEFAQELSGRLSLQMIVDERLKEIGFGVWEGRTPDEICHDDPNRLVNFWRNPVENRPEHAEAITDFCARVTAIWDLICATHRGKRVLVVGHAGITRMISTLVLGSPAEHMFRLQVDNAALLRVNIQGDGMREWATLVIPGPGK